MVRTLISFTPTERRLTTADAERASPPVSDLILPAVNRVYGPNEAASSGMSAIDAAFGSWSGPIDGGEATVDRARSAVRLERWTNPSLKGLISSVRPASSGPL